jgi:hypothetical protein
MTVPRVAAVAVLLCAGCATSHAQTGDLSGDARDRALLKSGTADYLQAKYLPDLLGRRHSLLERAKTQFEEVLNDAAATPKSKREATDMLDKVNGRLEGLGS